MANTKISNLTASAANLASTDLAPIVQTAGVGPVKMTGLQLAGGLLGSAAFNGATVTTSQPVLNLSQTWNAGAVTFTGLLFNATDTASAAASLLLDLQVGGSSKVSVTKAGQLKMSLGQIAVSGVVQINSGNTNDLRGLTASTVYGTAFQLGSGITPDIFLTRAAAASLQLGAADAAAPVAQTLQVQSVVAGTSNTAGANFTINGSKGTGTGAGGSIIFQVAPAGSSGTAQNAYATALTLNSAQQAVFAAGALATPSITFGDATTGFWRQATDRIAVSIGSVLTTLWTTSVIRLPNTQVIGWASGSPSATVEDTILARDAANTLALRNGANAQSYRIYNTYTDASNNEYLTLDWSTSANVATIGTVANGTGTVRTLQIKSNYQMNLYSAAGGSMFFFTNGTARWYFDGAAGHFLANADNTYDIGAAAATRPRYVYVGTRVDAPTLRTATAYTVATLPAAGTAGRRAYVTDATAPTFLGALTGGGAVVTPVFDNGTAWVAG